LRTESIRHVGFKDQGRVSAAEELHFGRATNKVSVERRPEGDYDVRRRGSERASAAEPTQAQAIDRAYELSNGGPDLVERVRSTSVAGRDKWRKP
jgi:hypothetical protein